MAAVPWFNAPDQARDEATAKMQRRLTQINMNEAIREQHNVARVLNGLIKSYTQPFYPLFAFVELPPGWKEGDPVPTTEQPEWWPINMSALDTWQDNEKLVQTLVAIGAATHGDDMAENKRVFRSYIGLSPDSADLRFKPSSIA